ncbi:Taurine dioxygenase, alpha-ketoglutarate-dependent [Duganella sp. CF458]|uniref:TauD/TfdA dioxygenase family protein n=1 Tax=Duganella sp. CF458 TaxID=1884368 RepID=UPI0008ED1F9A|nr:TauD/TfdA family dioxygenase [Duganella sp. CF458]SFG35319.1 Taurine dioxygenase, alpha-ketoglutarate-dependent [Duganella sp. CF458]
MNWQHFDIRILDAPLGAEIIGYNLGQEQDDNNTVRLRSALRDHHLLVFRGQRITARLQREAGNRLAAQALAPTGEVALFANLQMAYDTLPLGLRRMVHNARATQEGAACALPLVRLHPETGRRAILVANPETARVVGASAAESAQLLQELHAHATRSQHLYQHEWLPGDLLFWDQHSLMPVSLM